MLEEAVRRDYGSRGAGAESAMNEYLFSSADLFSGKRAGKVELNIDWLLVCRRKPLARMSWLLVPPLFRMPPPPPQYLHART